MLYPSGRLYPTLHASVRIADTADVIGDVTLGEQVSLWYGAVLRGDMNRIRLGAGTNVQDNAVLHVSEQSPTTVGRNVSIGHGAIVHGCTIADSCLIGMGAILMNDCVIGEGSVIAAGALIPEGAVIPPGSVVMGAPGRVKRQSAASDFEEIQRLAEMYISQAAEQLPLFVGRD